MTVRMLGCCARLCKGINEMMILLLLLQKGPNRSCDPYIKDVIFNPHTSNVLIQNSPASAASAQALSPLLQNRWVPNCATIFAAQ